MRKSPLKSVTRAGLSICMLIAAWGCSNRPAIDKIPASKTSPATPDAPTPAGPSDGRDSGAAENQPPDPDRQMTPAVGHDSPAAKTAPPFAHRVPAPSLEGGAGWLNTAAPLELDSLRGKFVLLDFWTYCCINCMHILPELKKLEQAYPNNVVVIGVHSAKFETERQSDSIRQAIMRYEIEHPVVNDAQQQIWERYSCQSWPTLRIIDPEGYLVAGASGEIEFESLDAFLREKLPYYRQQGLLDERPISFALERDKAGDTPLRFPGKILADEAGNRLFIADSNHNRIVMASLDGKLIATIGTGAVGRADGDYATAQFNHPQGMALVGEALYVADTENHLLRKIDLKALQVTTIAGTGEQGHSVGPSGGAPKSTALNSPWALVAEGKNLYIAMAGTHQIWKMPLDESEIGPYAGNGREDIVDGPLLPSQPYGLGAASLAQPSGLASDGVWVYVADSEGSSVRAVPLDDRQEVVTLIGTAHLREGRLFRFGDVDGPGDRARLQHCLDVVEHDGRLYVADTYNHKIKVINLIDRQCQTLAGTGKPGSKDGAGVLSTFFEPAGLTYAAGKLYVADTNNHRIRTISLDPNRLDNLNGSRVYTLEIEGLRALED